MQLAGSSSRRLVTTLRSASPPSWLTRQHIINNSAIVQERPIFLTGFSDIWFGRILCMSGRPCGAA